MLFFRCVSGAINCELWMEACRSLTLIAPLNSLSFQLSLLYGFKPKVHSLSSNVCRDGSSDVRVGDVVLLKVARVLLLPDRCDLPPLALAHLVRVRVRVGVGVRVRARLLGEPVVTLRVGTIVEVARARRGAHLVRGRA